MKFESIDHFGLDPLKLLIASALVGLGTGIVAFVAGALALGQAAAGLGLAIAGLGFYLTLSSPRRILYSQRVSQAREAVVLSEAVSALAAAMGSKGMVLLSLRSKDLDLRRSLNGAKKEVMLGNRVQDVARSSAGHLASYSASGVLLALGDLKRPIRSGESEETTGLAAAAALSRETKLPVFMTVCFFSPVVITLYASFSRIGAPTALVGLVIVEAMALDLAFQICSGERPRG